MENKLGLSDDELEEIMDELFAVKSKMVDYRFRFGSDHFGLTYLLGLHDNISQIAELINELVDAQIFEDGNSRTIHLFFDNVINCFFPEENDYTRTLKEEIRKTGRNL